MTVRRIRPVASMSAGLPDRDVARAVRQLEDRNREAVEHEHEAFARASTGFVPAPRGSSFGRVLNEDGAWRQSPIRNGNAADVVANAADTYLADGMLVVPRGVVLLPGTMVRWRFSITKTAAGVAVPAWNVRLGSAGSTADAALATIQGATAQTAAASFAYVEIVGLFRKCGTAADMALALTLVESTAGTGFSTVSAYARQGSAAAFDVTAPGLRFGVSVNPGAAGVWTHSLIQAELALA